MSDFRFFWDTMTLCDWSQEGDDALVLAPVVRALAAQTDAEIFRFHDQMSALLYRLDTKQLAQQCEKVCGFVSDDGFLYSRCVALINGEDYFAKACNGKCPEMWDMEIESLLYVPMDAWGKKHGASPEDYPHEPPLSFETGSNREGWQ